MSASAANGPISESALLANSLTTDGLGPLSIGMSISQVSRILGVPVKPEYPQDKSCGVADPYLRGNDSPIGLMFSNGALVRVSINRGSTRTPSGFGIGTAESAVRNRFGAALQVEPHAYVPGGSYLSFTATSDPSRRLVFETDGSKVTAMHGGRSPFVNYVEGCL